MVAVAEEEALSYIDVSHADLNRDDLPYKLNGEGVREGERVRDDIDGDDDEVVALHPFPSNLPPSLSPLEVEETDLRCASVPAAAAAVLHREQPSPLPRMC